MLSVGIRFGQGFDKLSFYKVMQSVPAGYDYDILVIGSNPGGVACAREARMAGKKTAIIKWQKYTPAEEEGFNENLDDMAVALEEPDENNAALENQPVFKCNVSTNTASKGEKNDLRKVSSSKSGLGVSKTESTTKTHRLRLRNKYTSRKVRRSRLDLNNELFKRGQQCRKLMYNASKIGEMLTDAKKCGWRVVTTTPSLSMNWHKMTECIMDYVMEENWKLMSQLNEETVEVIDGWPVFIDSHTVSIVSSDNTAENQITADIICIALSPEYIFPTNVLGAEKFGLNCDDLHRMSEPPGKTLIVGSTPEAMECAGIIANCLFPVTVVSQSKILKDYDSEISELIVRDMKKRGVAFMEETTLKSISMADNEKQLLANFSPNGVVEEFLEESNENFDETFDTVLFAVGKTVHFDSLNIEKAGIICDPDIKKIRTDQFEMTSVPNIYALGEVAAYRPEGQEIVEMAGKLLGKRLFNGETEIMDYSMPPTLILTPIEYAFVGLSEDTAFYRLGEECVSVHYGSFKPLDFVIPPKDDQCFAKVIVFKPKDAIIGIHFYGPEAGEMIQGFAAAIRAGLTMKTLRGLTGVPTTKVQEILKLHELRVHEPIEEQL